MLPINVNIHRFSNNIEKRLCSFCVEKIEDEQHFIIDCPMYIDLRQRFLPKVQLTLIKLLTCVCDENRIRIGKYIYYALARRRKS